MVIEVRAEGLPFKVESYRPTYPNTIVVPTDKEVVTPHTINKMTDTIRKIPQAIWTKQAREAIDASTDKYKFTTVRPDKAQNQSFIEVVEIKRSGAAWLKLKFRERDLGNAKLIISSLTTGQDQTFTSKQLHEWQGQSVMFFGDRLRVQLQVAPDSRIPTSVDDLIEKVYIGESLTPEGLYPEEDPNQTPEQQATDGEEVPCGHDTRKLSNNPQVGRMMPATCTAFILEGGVYATAGHCFRKNREIQTVEFNVPRSSEIGILKPADTKDVYPVLADTIICSDCGEVNLKHGKDWAVFLLGKNTETGRGAIEVQGGGFKIMTASTEPDVRIDGYGSNNNLLIAMYAQQTAKGEFLGPASDSSIDDVELRHLVDTQPGNSGSPMLVSSNTNGAIMDVVGIHTGGRCNSETGKANKGTGFSHKGLLQAVETLKNKRNSDL